MEKWIKNNTAKLTLLGFSLIILSFAYSIILMPKELRGGVMTKLDTIHLDQLRIENSEEKRIDKVIKENMKNEEAFHAMLESMYRMRNDK